VYVAHASRFSTGKSVALLPRQMQNKPHDTLTQVNNRFREQISSTAKRVKLAECLAFLREGDVLTATKPNRLARSTAELLSIEADLSKRGIGLVVLSMGGERLDTRNPTSKLMLTILAGVATWEEARLLATAT
jgi:DNA invertase Pin-like site-specific DNA recombinase